MKTRFPSWLVGGLFAVWGAAVFLNYLNSFPPSPDDLLAMLAPRQYFSGAFLAAAAGNGLNLLAGLAFVLACAGAGRFLLSVFKVPAMNLCEEISFSAALGLVVFAQVVLGLAVAGLLYRAAVVALLLVSTGLGVWSLIVNPREPQAGPVFKPGVADSFAMLLLGAALLLGLAGALSPEVFYDSLVYHLAVPNLYAIKHRLTDMPYNLLSNNFQLHVMLYTAGLLLKDEFVPKVTNYAAGVLSVLALLGLAQRHVTPRAGLWAALIFFTMMQTLVSSWSSGTEMLLAYFSLTALAAVLRYEPGVSRWLFLGAVLAGAAMAVKATGLLPALAVALVLAYRLRDRQGAARRALLLFVLVAAVPVLPWLVKNQVYRHNPVYPFLTSVFGTPAGADPQKIQLFISENHQLGGPGAVDWLTRPWKITMGDVVNSQFFSPLFLFLLPLLFLLGPSGPASQALWLYFLTIWLLWSSTSTLVRFLMPAYPAAALLMAAALEGRTHAVLKKALSVTVLLSCALGLYWAGWIYYSQGLWQPLTGLVTGREYLSSTRPAYAFSHYAAIEFINDKLPPRAKTLIVGDARSYYFRKDFVVSSVFDKTPAVEWAAASGDGDELYARMKAEGVTHLLVNTSEAIRLGRSYGIFYWDERTRGVFNDFWNRHLREVFARDEREDGNLVNRVAVYELVQALPPGASPAFNLMELAHKNIEGVTR